MRKVTAGDFPP
ncbi:hypothetical protein YPPY03_4677, partial [Yersinia pestis PY-03]